MDSFWIILYGALIVWLFVRSRGHSLQNQAWEERLNELNSIKDQLRALEMAMERRPEPASAIPVAEEATQPAAVFIQPKIRTAPAEAMVNLPPVHIPFTRPWNDPPQAEPANDITVTQKPQKIASLEEKLGANWLNKLGIVILVVGVAFFLAYQLRTLGTLGKTVTGFAVAATLLAGGLLMERRDTYRIFARAAIGGGWALTFFITYAMYHLPATHVISSQFVDLTLMLLVAAAMVWHSLAYKSQVVTALAFLLAFATIYISHVNVFSLVASAILAAGLVVVVSREHWYELELAGLIAVYLNHFLWLGSVLDAVGGPGHPFPQFFASAGLLLFYWFIFRIAYVYRQPQSRRDDLLPSITAVINSGGVLGLLKYQSCHPEWAFYGLLALGVAEMLFALWVRPRRRTAFIVLSSISSVLLLAAIPFRYSGSNWSLLWLLEAEALFLSGIRMREVVFRRLGILAGYAAAIQLFFNQLSPLFYLRQTQPDAARHLTLAVTIASAAILYWLNAELAPRRWLDMFSDASDRYALQAMSFLGLASAATATWVFFPASQTIVAWMLLVLALGWVADHLSSGDLSIQTDTLAVLALLRALTINLFITDNWGSIPQRTVTLALATALFYLCTRRKTRAAFFTADYIATAYSCVGTLLLSLLIWYQLRPVSVAVGWAILGLLLFELGVARYRSHLRWQGYTLLVASFLRIFFVNLNAFGTSHLNSPRVYTVLPLAEIYFWVYEHLQQSPPFLIYEIVISERGHKRGVDWIAQRAASFVGTISLSALIYFEFTPEWVAVTWSALVFVLILVARILHRRIFVAQAILLALAIFARAALFNFFVSPLTTEGFWTVRLITVGSTAGILLLSLPIAFHLRRIEHDASPDSPFMTALNAVIAHPEQLLFFVPLTLLTILLAVEMRAGVITIAWSALGVLTFLLALCVGERSYRLAGLGLLLLGVGKILCIDIWDLGPSDRYLTLIIMGVALLLVSFLYTRYKQTILKFL